MNNIAILASGSGTNAEAIMLYFKEHKSIRVACILVNKPEAGVIERAKRHAVPCYYYNNEEMRLGALPIERLQHHEVQFVILAGYLNLITPIWLDAYPRRIINIHPALLPHYGGKGMYGSHVHRAVIEAREKRSGITIHLVDEVYDHGDYLLQAYCSVLPSDTPEILATRIHSLEHRYFATTIEQFILTEAPAS